MKVCHVINTLNRGGAENHLFKLCSEQIKNNLAVHIVALGPDTKNIYSTETDLLDIGVKIHRLKGPRALNIFSYFRLRVIFNTEKFNIIHSHQPRSDYMVYIVKKYFKIKNNFKWIVSIHGKYDTYLDNTFNSRLKIHLFRKVLLCWESSDNVIVISNEVKDWLNKLNKNIEPNVINYWIENKIKQKTHANKEITFGFLGRLNKNKGIEDLIYSLNNINFDFQCLVGGVGTKGYLKYLDSKISKKNKNNFNFLGYVENQESFFNSIDIFIFPSFSEGLGLVLLEALSYKKLCITRDKPPMNQFVSDKNGYLFNNLEELTFQIELASKEFKKESIYSDKINNIEVILKDYDVKVLYPLIEKVYKS